MLYLIGLGLKEGDISLEGIEAARKCECYFENYTSLWEGKIENLEKLAEKKIVVIERKDMEEDYQRFLDLAKKKNICIFVIGDPLAATTHIGLVLECRKQGIKLKIIHGLSVLTAVAETGLQLYKFGRKVSLSSNGIENSREGIEGNRKLGLHTLLLLDIGMNVKEGIDLLLKNNIISKNEKIIACSQLGTEKQKIKYGSAESLIKEKFGVPAVLIIPGKLHFLEEEFLEGLKC